jgi:GTPase SAR1 family protein
MDLNDWGDGVRPSKVTPEMVQRAKVLQGNRAGVNVMVIGEKGAGKSTLTVRYVQDVFVEAYGPIDEECYRQQTSVLGATVVAEILDGALPEDIVPALWRQWLCSCEAIVVCVDISSRPASEALEGVRRILERDQLRAHPDLTFDPEHSDELIHLPLLLAATRCDLPRKVSGQELAAFARKYRMGLVVTSAKENIRVTEAFEECIKYAVARRLNKAAKERKAKGCVLM